MHYLLASLSSTSSAESINDPGFPLNGKSKGGDVGLDGDATVTFSHHYSEKAPSRGKKFVRNAFIEESRTKHSSDTGILALHLIIFVVHVKGYCLTDISKIFFLGVHIYYLFTIFIAVKQQLTS